MERLLDLEAFVAKGDGAWNMEVDGSGLAEGRPHHPWLSLRRWREGV